MNRWGLRTTRRQTFKENKETSQRMDKKEIYFHWGQRNVNQCWKEENTLCSRDRGMLQDKEVLDFEADILQKSNQLGNTGS